MPFDEQAEVTNCGILCVVMVTVTAGDFVVPQSNRRLINRQISDGLLEDNWQAHRIMISNIDLQDSRNMMIHRELFPLENRVPLKEEGKGSGGEAGGGSGGRRPGREKLQALLGARVKEDTDVVGPLEKDGGRG
ncbi:hypothetical protein WN55_08237 [Dufourea novaeangliae]|uniref:Uncharacterized protein n=1 Tax=Dufourea novaeangliae TaxID=178035 RepID=A0A154P699_DUFNO|nr:hypothetical protein WN55_08237 [Dufourea novaeangliae]